MSFNIEVVSNSLEGFLSTPAPCEPAEDLSRVFGMMNKTVTERNNKLIKQNRERKLAKYTKSKEISVRPPWRISSLRLNISFGLFATVNILFVNVGCHGLPLPGEHNA